MTRDDQLAELLERWEATLSRSRPTPTPEDLCRDCPELLEDFRNLLERLASVHALLDGDAAGEGDDLARLEAGRYRPLSFHAQGGLGVVYVAEDGELRRKVALKCLQRLTATDGDAQARFLLEAEITGKLEHPGVVPVYGLGRDAHGKPYYAMRFIQGATLGDAVQRFHSNADKRDASERNVELRTLIRRFVSVCETMAYAHARGVLHRDLKPSNIMLGPYGETLVLDWGLAKQVGSSAASAGPGLEPVQLNLQGGNENTMLGEVRGSPAYMSPEQARGEWDRVGTASDIYSLGATLYVLLTGNTPYTGGHPLEVVEKVKAGGCKPPRAVNPRVPGALDAICRKAMAFSPEARYPAAAELARDLERWLADEPVTAWREPLALRGRRWLRRHQTVTTTLMVSFLVAFVVLAIAGWRLDAKNKDLDKKSTELADQVQKEQKTRQRAENNLTVGHQLLADVLRFLHNPSERDRFKGDPALYKLLDRLEEKADWMLADDPNSFDGLTFSGRMHLAQAQSAPPSGLTPKLRRNLDLAQRRFEQALRIVPDNPEVGGLLGGVHLERAERLYAEKKVAEAIEEYDAALARHLPLGRTPKEKDNGMNALGILVVCLTLADMEKESGSPTPKSLLERIEKALAVLDPEPMETANRADRTFFAARLRLNQANCLVKLGKKEQAIAVLERALATVAEPMADDAHALGYADLRIVVPRLLAVIEDQQRNPNAAFRHMKTAYHALRAQAEKYPQALEQDIVQVTVLLFVSTVCWRAGVLDPALPEQRAERLNLLVMAVDALDWMEQTATARKWQLTETTRTETAMRRKQLEELRKSTGKPP